jgi:hypothetical protein
MTSRLLLVLPLAIAMGCVGPTLEPQPLSPEAKAAAKRLVLKQTYTAGVGGVEYSFPYGRYDAEGTDKRGVYYRAPIPIKKTGLFGLAHESLVEGGIYLPDSSFQNLFEVWFYTYDERGRIDAEPLPGNFNMTKGDFWSLEPAEP